VLAALARAEHSLQRLAPRRRIPDHYCFEARRQFVWNHGLPLVTLYLTERCNSRCVTCDYWRHGRRDVTLESVQRLLPSSRRWGTRTALISGGRAAAESRVAGIAALLRTPA
jgi:MoaA/NifB/PqqE/SkfB family radical SAM enzyme